MARLRGLRRLPLAVSGAARRFADDPGRGRAALERAWPAVRRMPTSDDLIARLDRAVAEDRLDEAEVLLERIPPGDPARASCEMSVRRLRGDLLAVAAAEVDDARGRRARRRARQQMAELSSPLPVWAGRPWDATPSSSGPARILHVVTNSLPLTQAGSTIRTQGVLAAQRAAGWDARAVTRPGYPVTYGDLDAADVAWVDGVPYLRLLPAVMPSESAMPRAYRDMLGRLVDAWRPHLLHAASDTANARAALEVGRREGIPVAYEARAFHEDTWLSRHGEERARDSDTYRWMRERHTEVMLAADLVTTLGQAMRADIIARGVDPDKVVVVPNAVPLRYLEDLRTPSEARAMLGMDEAFWVGTVATLHEAEGLGVMLEALAALRAEGVDARALIVGDGPARPGLLDLAERLRVPTVMPGRVPVADVLPYFDALDVFAMPRADTALNREVTGLKPLEAQARARPVVGSDLPAVAEVLAPGSPRTAPGDPAALAGALRPLLDPAERARLGDAGHAWVAAERTWPSVTARYGTAYAALGVPTSGGPASD